MNKRKKLVTSEAVCMGHPDKVADQISDAILDAMLELDPNSRVAVETLVKTGMVIVAGEVTTNCYVEIQDVVRQTIKDIGYTDARYGFDYESCAVLVCIYKQADDIALGVNENGTKNKPLGAGDQGMMYGYACNETPELMPAPIMFARRIVNKVAQVRREGTLRYLRPDGKTQVTVEYENEKPVRIHTVVLSVQHDADVEYRKMKHDLIELVIRPSLPGDLFNAEIIYHINPTGRFVQGGPSADCGLTGRKIMVDSYGSIARHGGGAFSGKDPTKVDRSGAYAARYAAKNIVAGGLADKCEVQLAYAIGVSHPVAVDVETFGTNKMPEEKIAKIVLETFDFTPRGMIEQLKLRKPIYTKTARFGHFGIDDDDYTWEKLDKVEIIKSKAKI